MGAVFQSIRARNAKHREEPRPIGSETQRGCTPVRFLSGVALFRSFDPQQLTSALIYDSEGVSMESPAELSHLVSSEFQQETHANSLSIRRSFLDPRHDCVLGSW